MCDVKTERGPEVVSHGQGGKQKRVMGMSKRNLVICMLIKKQAFIK